ncbi:MAG: hypothetical protein ABIK15_12830 [Pseudomonadota bacterium]
MGCKIHYLLVKWLKGIVLFNLFLQFFILSPGNLCAYILEGPHILHLAVIKMGAPVNIRVSQNLTFHDQQDPPPTLQETISYHLPEQFRSDIITEEMSKIYVFSHDHAITIINEKTSSTADTLLQYYKDPLLFQNRQLLEDRLIFLGINVAVTSLDRFENQIYYVIGAVNPDKPLPQLWIGKESFLPARFLILDQSDPNHEKIVEFRYLNWMKTEKKWYPMRIETYIDNNLIRTADALSVRLNSGFDDHFFNIKHLQTIYPPATPAPYEKNQTDDLEDVQQSIENLKRRFD